MSNDTPPARRAPYLVILLAVVIAGGAVGALLLFGTGSTPPEDRAESPPASASATSVMAKTVVYCRMDEQYTDARSYVVTVALDFTPVWLDEPYSCEAIRNSAPLTGAEIHALAASGDPGGDPGPLYAMCASINPENVRDTTAGQLPVLKGALALCPGHPLAKAMADAVDRGAKDSELEAEGRLFGDGTHLVGEDIQSGGYAARGDIDRCHWERKDSAGNTVATSAAGDATRAEVTIAPGDHSFTSKGCGIWRPSE
ncbi:hypothetical protein BAY61_08565 [Prauserella marina]|uniref:Uncharacterized protein n=1 Tax=Prauserella marina TaxID=530584 RepID=A0A222VMB2_9PSEU|nr:hypothetical protein [Prauserella marina]ASR35024.1 hypothetical protein BAY61_08565 [Prauserella marina]PWV85241.1 hypothetical protein DES30_1011267 [Prauserella marina]SDC01581.1 hypothetical protein SAMN05421630_10171 [Prauserella marina]